MIGLGGWVLLWPFFFYVVADIEPLFDVTDFSLFFIVFVVFAF